MMLEQAILRLGGAYDERSPRGDFFVAASCLIRESTTAGVERSYFLELRRFSDDSSQAVIRKDFVHANSGQSRILYQSAPHLLAAYSVRDLANLLQRIEWNPGPDGSAEPVYDPRFYDLLKHIIGPLWPMEGK